MCVCVCVCGVCVVCVCVCVILCRYCSPEHDFPEQADAISFVVRKTQEALRRNPSTLIISGTYTIGKEKVFLGMYERLCICVHSFTCVVGY